MIHKHNKQRHAAKILCAFTLSVMAAIGVSADEASAKIEISDYYEFATYQAPMLSPSGRYLVTHVRSDNNVHDMIITDRETGKRISSQEYGDWAPRAIAWLDDSHLAYLQDEIGSYADFDQLFNVIDVPDRRVVRTTAEGKKRSYAAVRRMLWKWYTMRLIDPLRHDPEHVLVTSINRKLHRDIVDKQEEPDRPHYFSDVYKLNIMHRDKMAKVETNPGDVVHWIADQDGNVRIAIAIDGNDLVYRWRPKPKAKWQPFFRLTKETDYDDAFSILSFSSDPNVIYVKGYNGHDTLGLHRFNLSTEQFVDTLFVDDNYDLTGVEYSPTTNEPVGVYFYGEKMQQVFFDTKRQGIYEALYEVFPDLHLDLTFTGNDDVALVRAFSDKERSRYYIYDHTAGTVIETQRFGELPADQMSAVHPVTIEASDAVALPGYLTKPEVAEANGALLLMVHGGPFGIRDHWAFNPDIQYLASRGYTVLQVNFRGSGGFGREFMQLGYGEWDRAIQDDLRDATLWAKRQGLFEGDKVCIYGGSFGGFSAMMSLSRFPDLYRCGVSFAGVSDLEALVRNKSERSEDLREFFQQTLIANRSVEELRDKSPVHNVESITAPIMVVHGERDKNVLPEQSKRFVEQLKKFDKEHKAYFYKNEGHGFESRRNQLHFIEALRRFLDKHLLSEPDALAAAGDAS
ncbi:MAG: alpha/beta hydrolase family protein [Gammaproteobacteria bacterium]